MKNIAKNLRPRLHDQAGAAMVEFALVLPMFLLLILGMLDFGKAFNYWIDGTHLSHEGARFAAVGKNPGPAGTIAASIKERADTAELKNGGTSSVSGPLSVCIAFPNGAGPKVGDPVEVSVTFTYKFLGYVTSMASVTDKTVTNKSTMRIERVTPDLYAQCV